MFGSRKNRNSEKETGNETKQSSGNPERPNSIRSNETNNIETSSKSPENKTRFPDALLKALDYWKYRGDRATNNWVQAEIAKGNIRVSRDGYIFEGVEYKK